MRSAAPAQTTTTTMSGRTALRALSGRLLLLAGRTGAADAPSCSGRAAAAAATPASAHAPRLARGAAFRAGVTTAATTLRLGPTGLRVGGPGWRRLLASAPDPAPPTAVASGAATADDHPVAPAAAPRPPPPAASPSSSDRPHPLDYTTLCALAAALRGVALPAKVDEVVQVDTHTACLRVRVAAAPAAARGPDDESGDGSAAVAADAAADADADAAPLETLWIWVCWHTMAARVTVGPAPPRGGPAEAYGFGRALHAALGGAVLANARCPLPYERCLELLFAEGASSHPHTALVLHAAGAPDNFLALVDVGVQAGGGGPGGGGGGGAGKRSRRAPPDAAPSDAAPPPSSSSKKAAAPRSGSAKTIRLPPEPPRLSYGRVLAVATARPGVLASKKGGGGGGGGGPGRGNMLPRAAVPVPGAKFLRPRPYVRHLVPSPSETPALWRSNIMAADADAAAFRTARAAAAAAAAAAEDEERNGDDEEEEERAPPSLSVPAPSPRLPDSAVAACIARTYAGVGRATADELCSAAGVDGGAPPASLDDAAWGALHAAWSRWLVSLAACRYELGAGLFGRPFSVLGDGGSLLRGGPLADRDPLALAAAAGAAAATAGDPGGGALPAMDRGPALELMAAVDAYYRQVKDAATPTTLEDHIRKGAAHALRRARDKAASLARQADRAATADAKAHTADLLMANVHAVRAGATEVTVADWETGADVTIPLGDGRTPVPDVAAALYKEARRLRRGEEAVGPLLEAARADVAELEAAAARLDALPPLGEEGEGGEGGAPADPAAAAARSAVLQDVRQALEAKNWLPPWREAGLEARGAAMAKRAAKRAGGGSGGRDDGSASPAAPSSASPFRRFTAPSGAEVLVGRNNRDNDRLSLRVANPGDTWLHARGVPGAHVVLRAPPGAGGGGAGDDGGPDDADLRFAAAIAAFFSKARDGGAVDVSHTPARNVKKPRGAPPGLVTLLSESVVRVRPDDAAGAVQAAAGDDDDD